METTAVFVELLAESMKDVAEAELEKFKEVLSQTDVHGHSGISLLSFEKKIMEDIVLSMLQNCGHISVEQTKKLLERIKRTDTVQSLSHRSSRPKENEEERLSALIYKVAKMIAVKELILETLKKMSYEELKKFKWLVQFTIFQRSLPDISWGRLQTADDAGQVLVVVMEISSQQFVEVIMEVFMDMNMTNLAQILSETSSELRAAGSSAEASELWRWAFAPMEGEKHSLDENWPALMQKVETMVSVIELLLETLEDLNEEELKRFPEFLSQTDFPGRFSNIPWMLLDVTDIVFLMVQTCGQQSVETIQEVLKKMKRTDLVQRLSHSSSGAKKKHSAYEHRSTLIQRVATIAAVKQLLLETLNDLSNKEVQKFMEFLQLTVFHRDLPDISYVLAHTVDRAEIACQMVATFGQQSVELTREVCMDMNRTDLVQRLSQPSSGLEVKHSVDEHRPAPSERAAGIAAVKKILLGTLNDLSYLELDKFKYLLTSKYFEKSLPLFSFRQQSWEDKANRAQLLVSLMVQSIGQKSVELAQQVFMDMNKTDLVQRLSHFSSGPKEKHSGDEHQPALFKEEATMTSVKEKLLEILEDLSYVDLKKFKDVLQDTNMKIGHPRIPRHRMEMADRVEIAELMVEIYGQESVGVIREVLNNISQSDLGKRLSNSLVVAGPSRSLKLEGCGSVTQDSSDWTKLEPKVKSTDADESPTYSLESEAGNFECSVSGLRWVCKEKVRFKYRFCSWGEAMERMESLSYMPAGPLIDITIIAGKLNEVFLPHWICIEDNPEICDKFAVLHISDCGDVVETVSEVTASHVKLPEPVFSPRAVLMKAGFPVKINCNVLIYKTNTAFLTLHIYLIPSDTGLQQAMDKRELSYGYNVIRKAPPGKSLKMHNRFSLTADLNSAEIYPEKLKLKYENRDSHFFEVFIENPETNFKLKLTPENERQPVWDCVIREDEYKRGHRQDAAPASPSSVLSILTQLPAEEGEGKDFVDKHQCDLTERVNNIGPILDNLLTEGVIQQEDYDTIMAIPTTQEKMRKLYSGPLKAGGHAVKEIFYKILNARESYLVADLKRNES